MLLIILTYLLLIILLIARKPSFLANIRLCANFAFVLLLSLLFVYAKPVYAQGVAAGTDIDNTVIINYQIGGVPQAPIESSPDGNSTPGLGNGEPTVFKVDRKIDLSLTGNANADVAPGQSQAQLTYTLKNEGNDTQEFSLIPDSTLTGDAFDATNCTAIVTGISGTALPGVNVPASGNILLKADQQADITVQCDIPLNNGAQAILIGDTSIISLYATAEKNADGSPVVQTSGADDANKVDTVFADDAGPDDANRDAMHTARRIYTAISSNSQSPTAKDDSASNSGHASPHNPTVIATIADNDSDPDGSISLTSIDLDPATSGIQSSFSNSDGLWEVDNLGNVSFTPAPGFRGKNTFTITYTVNDNQGNTSNEATLTVTYAPFTSWTCKPDFYLVSGQELKKLDPVSGIFKRIGLSTNAYNAIGWDRRNNLIYGIGARGTFEKQLVLIDASGVATPLGVPTDIITGAPLPAVFTAGDMDDNGNLWVRNFNPSKNYTFKINVDTNTYEKISFNGIDPSHLGDLVFIKSTNSLWGAINHSGVNGMHLVRMDLSSHTVSQILLSDIPHRQSAIHRSLFTDKKDNLYVRNSIDQKIYKISDYTSANPKTEVFINTQTIGADNDGASCPLANAPTVSPMQPPVANDDELTTGRIPDPNSPVTLPLVGANDLDLDGVIVANSIDLDPASPGDQKTLSTSDGDWTVDSNGNVTFTPGVNWTGYQTSINYTIRDNDDNLSNKATLRIIFGRAPNAVDDNSSDNLPGAKVTLNPLDNDSDPDIADLLDPQSVTLINADAASNGKVKTVAGEGVWRVDPLNGAISFEPEAGFINNPTPVQYTVKDSAGNLSKPATVRIEYRQINSEPQLTIRKTLVSVLDPDGGAKAVSGALATYKILVSTTGTGVLKHVVISDPTPAGMTYKANSIVLQNTPQSDAQDSDESDFGISKPDAATINLGDIAAGSQYDIRIGFIIN